MSDTDAILAANAAFYDAFLAGNIEQMSRLWADDDAVSCIHPGWTAIVGRTAVIGSWRDILLSRHKPQITCHEPHALITGDSGRVLCIERIGGMALAATNHFRRIDAAWRLVHHQSSPIAPTANQQPQDPGSRIH